MGSLNSYHEYKDDQLAIGAASLWLCLSLGRWEVRVEIEVQSPKPRTPRKFSARHIMLCHVMHLDLRSDHKYIFLFVICIMNAWY
jgi:hypothetical protein